jgi:putative transposase
MSYDALRRGRHSAPNQTYHVTIVTAGRVCHFADFDTARAVIAEMRRLNDRHIVDSFAWVLMPNSSLKFVLHSTDSRLSFWQPFWLLA